MRVWEYEIDPSSRMWILWVTDDAGVKTGVLNAPYNHRAKPGIEVYARFIANACNAAEQANDDHGVDSARYIAMSEFHAKASDPAWGTHS